MRLVALLMLLLALPGQGSLAHERAARQPVVVELFTAQGCGSCGEANELIGRLAERPGVLALTWPVDYWDYLGWTDTFAKPEFAERQKAYVARLSLREPYTPQVVVDGRRQTAGRRAADVETLLREATRQPRNPPDIRFVGQRRVDVGSGRLPAGGADVWLVRYDPREQEVAVRSGDNRGQTIRHRNVVREVTRLGAWRGRPAAFRYEADADDGLKTVVILQSARGGRVLGLAERPL